MNTLGTELDKVLEDLRGVLPTSLEELFVQRARIDKDYAGSVALLEAHYPPQFTIDPNAGFQRYALQAHQEVRRLLRELSRLVIIPVFSEAA